MIAAFSLMLLTSFVDPPLLAQSLPVARALLTIETDTHLAEILLSAELARYPWNTSVRALMSQVAMEKAIIGTGSWESAYEHAWVVHERRALDAAVEGLPTESSPEILKILTACVYFAMEQGPLGAKFAERIPIFEEYLNTLPPSDSVSLAKIWFALASKRSPAEPPAVNLATLPSTEEAIWIGVGSVMAALVSDKPTVATKLADTIIGLYRQNPWQFDVVDRHLLRLMIHTFEARNLALSIAGGDLKSALPMVEAH